MPGRCRWGGERVAPEDAPQGPTLLPRPTGGQEAAHGLGGIFTVAESLMVLPGPEGLPGQVEPTPRGAATLGWGGYAVSATEREAPVTKLLARHLSGRAGSAQELGHEEPQSSSGCGEGRPALEEHKSFVPRTSIHAPRSNSLPCHLPSAQRKAKLNEYLLKELMNVPKPLSAAFLCSPLT